MTLPRSWAPALARPRGVALLNSTAMAGALLVTQTSAVLAQDLEADVLLLDEITVSGTKRDVKIEEFAGSVSVETGDDLSAKNIDDGFGLVSETPGVNQYGYGDRSNAYATIRGVGPVLVPLSPDDSSVLTFVDGVPLMLEQSTSSYLDLEQVEVFKGPQNTLFGRATSGGAINLVPVEPSDVPEGRITVEYGSDDEYKAEFVGNIPIIQDVLSARLALRKTGLDGFVPNTAGPDLGGEDISAGRFSLQWTPSAQTSVLFSHFAEDVDLAPQYYYGQIADGAVMPGAQSYSIDQQKSHISSLKIEHDFDAFKFTSQTSYNSLDMYTAYQGDHNFFAATTGMLPSDFAVAETNRIAYDKDQTRLNQEFRLSSHEGSPVGWVAGLVGYRDEYDILNNSHVFLFQGAQSGISDFEQTTEGASVFGDASVPVTDRLTVSGGLRYTHETKEFSAAYDANGVDALYPGVLPNFSESGRESYSYWTGKLAVDYDWGDAGSAYASVSRGYKSGGFGVYNSFFAYGVPRGTYKPSETLSYEIGGRTSLFNGSVDLSGALFHINMTDEQIMLFDFNTFGTGNANIDAKSTGLELDATWYIDGNWTLETGLAYTKTRIKSVPDNAAALNPGLEEGDQLPNTPKLAANIALAYHADTAEFGWTSPNAPQELTARVGYSYTGDRYFDAANIGKIEETHLVSARFGLKWASSELYLFGENLLDEDYFLTRQPYGVVPGTSTPVFGVSSGRGRSIGIGFTQVF